MTVKSCSPENLPETIDLMMQGLGRLLDKTKRTRLRITSDWIGFVRTIEITVNPMTGELHPHVHILFLTPARSPRHHTTEWVQAWRQAARLDYDPVCDIRSVRGAEKGLAEVLKYATKPAKLAHNAVTLAQAMAALKGANSNSLVGA